MAPTGKKYIYEQETHQRCLSHMPQAAPRSLPVSPSATATATTGSSRLLRGLPRARFYAPSAPLGIPPEPPAATAPRSFPVSPNATATAAAGRNWLLRRARATRRAASTCLCTSQRRPASHLRYLPPAVPCPAMMGPRAPRCRCWCSRLKRPAGDLSPADVALFPAFPCTAEESV